MAINNHPPPRRRPSALAPPGTPSDFGALVADNARLTNALKQLSGKRGTWVVLLIALAGTPTGIEIVKSFRPAPAAPPAATKDDVRIMTDRLDRIAQTQGEQTAALNELKKESELRLRELERFADRLTPPNQARLPRR